MMARYVRVLAEQGEYDILTVDVTYKIAAKQVAAAKNSTSGVLTVCGASRTLLGAVLCEGEGPHTVIEKLTAIVPPHVRGRVRFVVRQNRRVVTCRCSVKSSRDWRVLRWTLYTCACASIAGTSR